MHHLKRKPGFVNIDVLGFSARFWIWTMREQGRKKRRKFLLLSWSQPSMFVILSAVVKDV
jgi:hypothetical protein